MKDAMKTAMERLQSKGIHATEDQILATVKYGFSDKRELSDATLAQVAGGVDPATLMAIISTLKETGLLDGILEDLGLGGGDKKDGGNGGNTNKQENLNDHGQQVNVQGDKTDVGGMKM